ncbi:IclR family transcriptional regulator [Streptacidiphilus monticola]|uniref:IclR family transcriptional regulator n=1 Tax=Streptacidiphilus monticola TaxID=2161674 RepID=A0ABW1FY88_9ACTN
MAQAERTPTLIGSVQRALRLLEAVGRHRQGATAKQLARAADLPLPTAYHLLRTLAHEGYLVRSAGLYRLGESVSQLTGRHEQAQGHEAIQRLLHELREQLGAATYFGVYRHGRPEIVALSETAATPAVDVWADIGATGHAHAIGQCLLGQLDREGRLDYLSRHRPEALTPRSVTDPSVLLRRWEARHPGRPVMEYQEYAPGVVCAAVPVTVGAALCTVALSLPAEQAHRLPSAAERLSQRVGAVLERFAITI